VQRCSRPAQHRCLWVPGGDAGLRRRRALLALLHERGLRNRVPRRALHLRYAAAEYLFLQGVLQAERGGVRESGPMLQQALRHQHEISRHLQMPPGGRDVRLRAELL
jgi:hypothetical protein